MQPLLLFLPYPHSLNKSSTPRRAIRQAQPNSDQIEREAIRTECLQCLLVRYKPKFLSTLQDYEHAVPGDDVRNSSNTASLDPTVQESRASKANGIALQTARNSRGAGIRLIGVRGVHMHSRPGCEKYLMMASETLGISKLGELLRISVTAGSPSFDASAARQLLPGA